MGIRIVLAGNPNAGKTTLFNALTGANQFVGNWPGVTVEKKEGKLKGHSDVIITDLPGIYSLSPYTLEEVVARNYLIVERTKTAFLSLLSSLQRANTKMYSAIIMIFQYTERIRGKLRFCVSIHSLSPTMFMYWSILTALWRYSMSAGPCMRRCLRY